MLTSQFNKGALLGFDKVLYDREYRVRNKNRLNAYQKVWYHNNLERFRGYRLKGKFGISLDDYTILLKAQDYKCAICKSLNAKGPAGTHYLAVDHCHVTGKIRGLLCSACNRLLGRLETSNGAATIAYLKEHR